MLEANRSENIEIFSLAEVNQVDGYVGNFEVDIVHHPRYVKMSCNGCGACLDVCPVHVGSEFDQGLGSRGAIYIPFAQAVPLKALIDIDNCIECGACVNACNLSAIDFEAKEKHTKIKVGGIIVATGWDEWRPDDGYLGYNKYDNVVSQLEYERMLAPNGPVVGHIKRPSDGKTPKKILFVQCAGSRDIKRNPWCSGGVCCMVSIKNANLSREHGIEATVAYIDIRASGKDYEEYYKRIRESGVRFIRSKISQIREDKETKDLKVVVDEHTAATGETSMKELTFDMAVLSTAMAPSKGLGKLVDTLGITSGPNGFLTEYHSRLNPVDTRVPGIALAGASQGPKSISETIMQAKGTSSSMSKLVNVGKYTIELVRAINDVEKCCVCQNCIKVCPAKAISINSYGSIQVDEILCTGCGLCVSVCPNEAMTIRYYRDNQLNQQIDAFLDDL